MVWNSYFAAGAERHREVRTPPDGILLLPRSSPCSPSPIADGVEAQRLVLLPQNLTIAPARPPRVGIEEEIGPGRLHRYRNPRAVQVPAEQQAAAARMEVGR